MRICFPEIDTGRSLIISHIQPFGARVDIEIIKTPRPVRANRSQRPQRPYEKGRPTTYIHFLINQVNIEPDDLYDSLQDADWRSSVHCHWAQAFRLVVIETMGGANSKHS